MKRGTLSADIIAPSTYKQSACPLTTSCQAEITVCSIDVGVASPFRCPRIKLTMPYWSRGGGALQSPQSPPTESILTALLNDITTVPDNFVLVLDDYHVLDAKLLDTA